LRSARSWRPTAMRRPATARPTRCKRVPMHVSVCRCVWVCARVCVWVCARVGVCVGDMRKLFSLLLIHLSHQAAQSAPSSSSSPLLVYGVGIVAAAIAVLAVVLLLIYRRRESMRKEWMTADQALAELRNRFNVEAPEQAEADSVAVNLNEGPMCVRACVCLCVICQITLFAGFEQAESGGPFPSSPLTFLNQPQQLGAGRASLHALAHCFPCRPPRTHGAASRADGCCFRRDRRLCRGRHGGGDGHVVPALAVARLP
jgi:hypothetical protein